MDLFTDPESAPASAAGDHDPIEQVRTLQRALAAGACGIAPPLLLASPAWQDAAQYLTRYHFHQWVRKDLEGVESVEQLYRHVLYWYPVIRRCLPHAYLPRWHAGRVLAWLAESIGPDTGRWWMATQELADRGPAGVSGATDNALAVCGGEGREWTHESMELLWRASLGRGPKARLAALAYEPLAYADVDRGRDGPLGAAGPDERDLRQGDAVYLRLGRTVVRVGDAEAMARRPELAWTDLRGDFVEVLAYRVRWREAADHGPVLEIALQPRIVDATKARLRSMARGVGSPAHKLRLINDTLSAFEIRHRWASGADWQFGAIRREASALVRQHLAPLGLDVRDALYTIATRHMPCPPEPDPLSDLDVPEKAWTRLFSPYR